MKLILGGPSGVGKTSVIRRLIEREPSFTLWVSYTTRALDADDVGRYEQVPREVFERMEAAGDFLETTKGAQARYGTPWGDLREREDDDIVFDVDTNGRTALRAHFPDAVTIFLMPPSPEELERRLRRRNRRGDDIEKRLQAARQEMARAREYDHIVINEDLERCVAEVMAITRAERERRRSQREAVELLAGEPEPA